MNKFLTIFIVFITLTCSSAVHSNIEGILEQYACAVSAGIDQELDSAKENLFCCLDQFDIDIENLLDEEKYDEAFEAIEAFARLIFPVLSEKKQEIELNLMKCLKNPAPYLDSKYAEDAFAFLSLGKCLSNYYMAIDDYDKAEEITCAHAGLLAAFDV